MSKKAINFDVDGKTIDNLKNATKESKYWLVVEEDFCADDAKAITAGSYISIFNNYRDAECSFAEMVECESHYDESYMCNHWDNRYTYMGSHPDGEQWFGVCSPDTSQYAYVNLVPLDDMDENWLIRACEKIRFNRMKRSKIREGSVVKKQYAYKNMHRDDRVVDSIEVSIPCNGEFDEDYNFYVSQIAEKELANWVSHRPNAWEEIISGNPLQIPGDQIELPVPKNLYYCDFADEESLLDVTSRLTATLSYILGRQGVPVRFFFYTDDLSFYICTDAEFGVVATVAELVGKAMWEPYDELNT